jgi:hypothetical protein
MQGEASEQKMVDGRIEFHLTEYTSIRNEIVTAINTIYSLAFATVAANAFIVTWILTQFSKEAKISPIYIIASWLPLIVTGVSWILYVDRVAEIRRLGSYCRLVEEKFSYPDLGWEAYAKRVSKDYKFSTRKLFKLIFFLLTVMSFCFGLYMTLFLR